MSHVRDLAPAVAARGVDVTVICADEHVAEEFRGLGVGAEVVPLRHKLDIAGAASLPSLLRAADVVHSHDRRAGLFARTAARMVGARAVHTMHGVPDGSQRRFFQDLVSFVVTSETLMTEVATRGSS